MRVEVDVSQPLGRQVRVDLGGADVGVSEHLLQRAQVTAACEQVRGKRVAQRVRAHALLQTRAPCVALDDLVEPLARQSSAAQVDEHPRLVAVTDQARSGSVEVVVEALDRLGADRDDPFLGALAPGAQDPRLKIHV